MKTFTIIAILLPIILKGQIAYNDFTPTDKQPIVIEQFTDNSRNWIINNKWLTGNISDNSYTITCKNLQKNIGISYIPVNFDHGKNFEIEVLMDIKQGNGGIILGMADNYTHYRVEINNNKWLLLLRNNNKKQLPRKIFRDNIELYIKSHGINRITIRKIDKEWYFYFNKHLVNTKRRLRLAGNNYGVSVDLQSEIKIKEFKISYLTQTFQLSTKLASSLPNLEIEQIQIEYTNKNVISGYKEYDVIINIKNTGETTAKNLKAYVNNSSQFYGIQFPKMLSIPDISPKKTIAVSIPMQSNKLLPHKIAVPININLSETDGYYTQSHDIVLAFTEQKEEQVNHIDPLYISDVDKNIPDNGIKNPHRYALVIGNEDYSSYQTGLSSEINVDFAVNDAEIFTQYAIKTLGVPKKQVKLVKNATTGQMRQALAWIKKLIEIENGNAEVFFYYAGHGLPDETSHQPYLIPVDVNATYLSQAIKLSEVLSELTEFPAQKVIVLLDACFSGGARHKPLITRRSIAIRPKETHLIGNTILFTSSSGTESSGAYHKEKHGFFTYYLLKKLQETQGNLSYGDWAEYIKQKVSKESAIISKPQNPKIKSSLEIMESWRNWNVNSKD